MTLVITTNASPTRYQRLKGGYLKPLTAAHTNTVGIGDLNLKGRQGRPSVTQTRSALWVAARKFLAPIQKRRKWDIMLLAIFSLRDSTPFRSGNDLPHLLYILPFAKNSTHG